VFRIDMVYIEIFACCLVVDLIDRSIRFSRFAAPARRRAGNNYTHSGALLARLSEPPRLLHNRPSRGRRRRPGRRGSLFTFAQLRDKIDAFDHYMLTIFGTQRSLL
jgi:hypothetical protein